VGEIPSYFSSSTVEKRGLLLDIIKSLLREGADPNARNKESRTPLHIAAQDDYEEAVKELIEKGANVNLKDDRGYTPLMIAVEKGNVEIINSLCPKVDFTKENHTTAMSLANGLHLFKQGDVLTSLQNCIKTWRYLHLINLNKEMY